MKLLAVSDIHGKVEAVKTLRACERNRFDAVVVAGDIGGKAAPEIMAMLATFACPVLYILGNWDRDLPYDCDFGPSCHHLHLRSVECSGWAFAGFSGLPAGWGKNPIATALKQELTDKHLRPSRVDEGYGRDLRQAGKDALRLNRQALAKVISTSSPGPRRTIVVTHERLSHVERDLPGVPLFLFGHRHGFQSATFKGAMFVNVSVLHDPTDNGSSYTVIDIEGERVQARSIKLAPSLPSA